MVRCGSTIFSDSYTCHLATAFVCQSVIIIAIFTKKAIIIYLALVMCATKCQ